MAKAATIDAYIAAQPQAARAVLARVRAILARALPDAREVISYGIPAYRTPAGVVIFFAGWAEHWSLYPISQTELDACGVAPGTYAASKGTVRFPLKKAPPARLIAKLAKLKRADLEARAAAKKKAKR